MKKLSKEQKNRVMSYAKELMLIDSRNGTFEIQSFDYYYRNALNELTSNNF